jgi:hypothetical protein
MKDLTNKVYGLWVVVEEGKRNSCNKRMWLCECACGYKVEVVQDSLTRGLSNMCKKCSARKAVRKQDKFLRVDHRLYSIWKGIKKRVYGTKSKNYDRYGGRGITLCDRWHDFLLFIKDMEESFEEGLTLDRVDNNKGYTPENCRWATKEQQNNNQERSLKLLFKGVYYTESQLARETGVPRTTIQSRRRLGYSVEEMVYGKKQKI